MSRRSSPRIVWNLHALGGYWQPIISEFARLFPDTTLLTADWPGYLKGFENSFAVKEVGSMKVLQFGSDKQGYRPALICLSPAIFGHLSTTRPCVIFALGFSLWTVFSLLAKMIYGCRVVIIYEGSAPGVDHRNVWWRSVLRRIMARRSDACISNTNSGKEYLTEILHVKKGNVFVRPIEVPHPNACGFYPQDHENSNSVHPVFITVGQLIPRKGVKELFRACAILTQRGRKDFTLAIVGSGPQHDELVGLSKTLGLGAQVTWVGQVPYDRVGTYLSQADVFILSTLEDTWGVVTSEAMMLGKPVLCSRFAGSSELVREGENGYVFDPNDAEHLADLMERFMLDQSVIALMGRKSKEIMKNHTPAHVAQFLKEVVNSVLDKETNKEDSGPRQSSLMQPSTPIPSQLL